MSWLVIEAGNDFHVVPTDERHELTAKCKCKPKHDEDIIVHNSYDNRERLELQ